MPIKGNGLVPVVAGKVSSLESHRKYGYGVMLVLLCGLILSYWRLQHDVERLERRLAGVERAVPTQMNIVPTVPVECPVMESPVDLDSFTPNPW